MTSYRVSFGEQSHSVNPLSMLENCVSFDLRGLKDDVTLARLRVGKTPEVLLSGDSIISAAKKLGIPVNDMRSSGAALSEWNPSPADMFRQARETMSSEINVQEKSKARLSGPKLG